MLYRWHYSFNKKCTAKQWPCRIKAKSKRALSNLNIILLHALNTMSRTLSTSAFIYYTAAKKFVFVIWTLGIVTKWLKSWTMKGFTSYQPWCAAFCFGHNTAKHVMLQSICATGLVIEGTANNWLWRFNCPPPLPPSLAMQNNSWV